MARMLTVWDSSPESSECNGRVYTWNGYTENDSTHSLLRYVERHGDRLRHKYFAWIHDLGESQVNGKRLTDHLVFEDSLSYWWMTLFVEQSPWNSPAIVDAIRLFALEEIIAQDKPCNIRLVSANRSLHEVLSDLCQNVGIPYEWEQLSDRPLRQMSLRNIYLALPHPVQALICLGRYLLGRWPFRYAEKSGWFGGERALFFCSYFDNVDPKAAEQKRFQSNYWTDLPALLNRIECQSNWLQLFVPCGPTPTPRAAMGFSKNFNRQRQEQGFHTFLDAFLSWRLIWRVIKQWFYLARISLHLSEIKRAFRPGCSRFSLWPFFREDWYSSMRGPKVISNLLSINLFDMALRDLPYQKKGFYLFENQAWERALIHAWRKHGHGQLIGVVHSTVRFWDLRYFTDPRTFRSLNPHPMPRADLMALNSKSIIDAYLNADYPKHAIAECEALRYGYLNNLRTEHISTRRNSGAINVLILGDYTPASTFKMLQLLEAAAPLLSGAIAYTLKPHPNCPVKTTDFPDLHLKIIMDPLADILHDFDISYTGNLTSAAVDAYLAGLPIVVMLDGTGLNFSSLRGQPDVPFVSTAEELAKALCSARQNKTSRSDSRDFFFLDPELPRWFHLLTN